MLLAGFAHRCRAVALGEHHHRAAEGLELVDEAIHPAGRGRAEGARGHAVGRLGWAGVIDRVVLEIVRHALPALQPLANLGMGRVARDDDRAGEREARLDRILRQRGQNLAHRPVEVDLDDIAAERGILDLGQVFGRIGLQRLEIDAVLGDLALGLTIRRAGDAKPDRQRGAVARQADDADVMAEILAAELRADAERLRQLVDLLSISRSRKAWPEGDPCVGSASRYFVEASLTVLRFCSAEVPPMTMAR
jgi:hypothetical protein